MKFLLDQSADARLVAFLTARGDDATRIGRHHPPGLSDEDVLDIAYREGRVLLAEDTDFGWLVFVELRPHAGVILFRLGDHTPIVVKVERLAYVLVHHAAELDRFVVVTRTGVRIRS